MGIRFDALSKTARLAVADHVRREFERLTSLQPETYVSRNAKADPQRWQDGLRELIAGDPKRVESIVQAAERKDVLNSAGFTLIELSIVLVVIGLIVGGVLVGQDLIKAAAERAQITQIEKFNSAANTFFSKYGYLPGDIPAGPATEFGFAARGTLPGQGDGDGILECTIDPPGCLNHGYWTGETVMFWSDLSAASLIEGSFTTATSAGSVPTLTTGAQFASYFPVAKLGNGNFMMVLPSDGYQSGMNITRNYFGVIRLVATNAFSQGVTVRQAYDIDTKIDDGKPFSGRVTAGYAEASGTLSNNSSTAQAPSATTCWDNNSVQYAPVSYSITQNGGAGVNCQLSFQMQAGD